MTGASHSDLPFVHEDAERGRGEHLGVGRDAEERLARPPASGAPSLRTP